MYIRKSFMTIARVSNANECLLNFSICKCAQRDIQKLNKCHDVCISHAGQRTIATLNETRARLNVNDRVDPGQSREGSVVLARDLWPFLGRSQSMRVNTQLNDVVSSPLSMELQMLEDVSCPTQVST